MRVVNTRTQGFTIVELLIACAIALLMLAVIGSIVTNNLKLTFREQQNLPVQQQLRASIEVISQEIRQSVGPRVMYANLNGTGNLLPAALPLSGMSTITLLIPVPNSTFIISAPSGYPANTTLPARVATIIQQGALTSSGTAQTCAGAFTGNEYAVLYGTQQTNYLGAARNPDAFRIMQAAAASPCIGSGSAVTFNHPLSPLPTLNWNPNTYLVEVTPVTYSLSNQVLYRTVAGQSAQLVSRNIASFSLRYLPDNPASGLTNCQSAVFYDTPGCAPRQISVSLTSTPQRTAADGSTPNLTASQTVFLR